MQGWGAFTTRIWGFLWFFLLLRSLSIFSRCFKIDYIIVYVLWGIHAILLCYIEKRKKFNRDEIYKYQNFFVVKKIVDLIKFENLFRDGER